MGARYLWKGRDISVVATKHVEKRLRDKRQRGITINDVQEAAKSVPGKIPVATRFNGFCSRERRKFSIVMKDTPYGRSIITVIGL